jgi:uncharacterized protein (TIGR02246 family)
MKKWLSAAVGLILFIPVISLAGPAGDEAQSVAIAMVNRFVDSWNRADGAAYGENYWPDSELVDPTGAIKSGRTAIEQEHAEMWAGTFKGSRIQEKCGEFKCSARNT